MTLISYDAAFHIKDITTAHPSPCTPPSFPSLPFAQSEACPPLVLSPSSFGHERRETSAAPLPRRNLDLGAFAFSTLFQWMCERVTQVLSHWMALKNRHSANAPNKQALPLPPPPPKTPPPLSSTYCHTQLVALEGSPLCWFVLLRHLHTVEFALRKKRDTERIFLNI